MSLRVFMDASKNVVRVRKELERQRAAENGSDHNATVKSGGVPEEGNCKMASNIAPLATFGGGTFNNAFVRRLFRPVDNMVWDMSTGKVGILTPDGITTVELGEVKDGKADDAGIVINPITDFSIALPAFAQSVPAKDINLGDMIFSADKPLGWVVGKTENGKFELLKKDGTSGKWNPPAVSVLGFDTGVLVLRSLFNMLPGGADGVASLNNMLMPLMMMGGLNGDDDSLKQIMPIMLMSQMGLGGMTPGAGNNMMQSFMMMAMMKNFMGGSGPKAGGRTFFDK